MAEGSDWFLERHSPTTGLTFAVRSVLVDRKSPYQHVQVFDTPDYGRVLVLDQCVMLTERDEFVYHEMITHPALLTHPNPERVLIIGGGDGGTVREVLRHEPVEHVDLVEIDKLVVDVSREHFPEVACMLDDPRVTVQHKDGFDHLEQTPGSYDVILTDSIDPVGPAAKLFTTPYYSRIKEALRPGGVAVFQTESPYFNADVLHDVCGKLRPLFTHVAPYLAFIPTYPSGCWSFTFVSDAINPRQTAPRLHPEWLEDLRYFNEGMLQAAFRLPTYVQRAIAG